MAFTRVDPEAAQCFIDLTVQLGRLTNPAIRPVGIAINTLALDDDALLLLTLATLAGAQDVLPVPPLAGRVIDQTATLDAALARLDRRP